MAEWRYHSDPKRNARSTLINQMPGEFGQKMMKMQGETAEIISMTVPRRQEDHPDNSQKYKQFHEDE